MTERLSKEKIQQYKMAFELFDKDGSRTIAVKDLGIIMRSLGENPTQGELDEIIRDHKRKRKGSKFSEQQSDNDTEGGKSKKQKGLGFEEFLYLMADQVQYSHSQKELIEMFKIFDLSGDGSISVNEIYRVLNGLGQKIQMTEVKDMIKEADLDGDEHINYEEFSRMMKRK